MDSSMKLIRDHFRRKYRLKDIPQQMLNFWNLLSEDIAEAESTIKFKEKFNTFVNASP